MASQILNEANLVFVSIDEIFHRRGFDWNTNKLPNEHEWQEIFDESYRQVKGALQTGRGVLYDSTNQTVASRDKLREIAEERAAKSHVIYVKADIETIWKRWEKNNINPIRSIVRKDLVQMTIDMFEEPEEWEHVTVIRN
jgi:tRNA uridine 5-carbamoylmethylation protein Kti12